MTEPLYIDEQLEEQERARLRHVLGRWLKKFIPVIAYHGPPRARRSIESQLLTRPGFSPELWSECGPPAEVAAILEIIQEELALPSHNFIPDDPVVLIMSSGHDRDDVYALIAIEKRYAVEYRDEEVEQIRKENWTLGRFVKDILARRRNGPGVLR